MRIGAGIGSNNGGGVSGVINFPKAVPVAGVGEAFGGTAEFQGEGHKVEVEGFVVRGGSGAGVGRSCDVNSVVVDGGGES